MNWFAVAETPVTSGPESPAAFATDNARSRLSGARTIANRATPPLFSISASRRQPFSRILKIGETKLVVV